MTCGLASYLCLGAMRCGGPAGGVLDWGGGGIVRWTGDYEHVSENVRTEDVRMWWDGDVYLGGYLVTPGG